MASDDNLSTDSVNFNRFDWSAAPEPWRSIGLAWRRECQKFKKSDADWQYPPPPLGRPPSLRLSRPTPEPEVAKPVAPQPVAPPAVVVSAVAKHQIRPLRNCRDCTWCGPPDEYAFHRMTDHG